MIRANKIFKAISIIVFIFSIFSCEKETDYAKDDNIEKTIENKLEDQDVLSRKLPDEYKTYIVLVRKRLTSFLYLFFH